MKNLLLLVCFVIFLSKVSAQVIQGTLRIGSDPKEVILTIRNNSSSPIIGNLTKVQFTVSQYYGNNMYGLLPMDALKHLYIHTIPQPSTGSFSSRSFVSYLSHYLATTWTGTKAVDLDPGEEMDVFAFSLQVEGKLSEGSPLRLQYYDPMYADDRNWVVEVNGVNQTTGGTARYYSSGPSVDIYNELDNSTLTITNFGLANLPVRLEKFEAGSEGEGVQLTWSTAEEINSDYFSVEHSLDAKQWKQVGKVNSYGESKELRQYDFTHANAAGGINYYRLKMVDLDGTFVYSKIVDVKIGSEVENAIYPNPATSTIAFKKELSPCSKVRILDVSGKVVFDSVYLNSAGTIPLDRLSQGLFFVEVTDGITQPRYYKVLKR